MNPFLSNEAPAGTAVEESGTPSTSGLTYAQRAWLECLLESLRSVTAQWMHRAARVGAASPEAVLFTFGLIVGEHIGSYWNTAAERSRLRPVVEAVQRDFGGACSYAAWVLAWEQLPADEQQRRKAERGRQYQQEAKAAKAPSERQIAYLRSLGYAGPAPGTMAEASSLINKWKDNR
jgi:hypothetical protein